MTIQCKFFAIPVLAPDEAEVELNHFLKTIRLIHLKKELVQQEDRAYWAVAVEYMPMQAGSKTAQPTDKKRIDYKEVLSPEDFEIFAKLRDWRKETATKEGVQLYTVFTNEQLAAIVEKKFSTKEGLRSLEGVGDARIAKYGDAIIHLLQTLQ